MIAMQDAWPGVTPRVVRGQPDADHVFYAHAVSPDARWLLGEISSTHAGATERPWVVMVEVATGRQQRLHQMANPQSSAGLTDSDARWFVWAEASDQPNHGDWTIYAFDRVAQQLVQVGAATQQSDGHYLPSSVWPQVDHGIVVWSEEVAGSADRAGRVLAFELPAGPAKVVATSARGGAISWPYIAFAPQATAGGSPAIATLDLRDGRQVTTTLPAYNYAAIDGTAVAYVTNMKELWYTSDPTAHPRLVARAWSKDGFLQFPRMSPRFIGWESTSFPGVYDRVLDRIVLVDTPGNDAGWTFIPKGDALLWALSSPLGSSVTTPKDYAVLDLSAAPRR